MALYRFVPWPLPIAASPFAFETEVAKTNILSTRCRFLVGQGQVKVLGFRKEAQGMKMLMHFLMPVDSNETLQKELPWPKILFEAYCSEANEASQPIFSNLMSKYEQWMVDSLDARNT